MIIVINKLKKNKFCPFVKKIKFLREQIIEMLILVRENLGSIKSHCDLLFGPPEYMRENGPMH